MSSLKKKRAVASFSALGMGQGTLSFSKRTQTRFLTLTGGQKMNIKSLIIGSAAALATVTGAKAADAVVVPEPEPVEYVRVCDMYGAGFFYIPGTETCLAVSGLVWFQLGFNSTTDWYAATVRARVNFDARNETEWGTLRSYIRIQGDWDAMNQVQTVSSSNAAVAPIGTAIGSFNYGTDGIARIDQAYITIGGLFVGYSEGFWADSKNGGPSNYGSHSWSGLSYGYQQRHLIAYRFEANGFFGSLSLEDDGNANFMPDIVGKVGFTSGAFTVWARVAYDEDLAPATAAFLGARAAGLSGVDGWAAQLGAHINVPNMPGSSFRVIGFYASNANAFSVGGRWSVLASYNQQFSPTFGASIGAQYIADTNFAAAGSPSTWIAELSIVATPVTNLEIRAELTYTAPSGPANNVTSGFLRLTRYF
jgi:hypothetical protein